MTYGILSSPRESDPELFLTEELLVLQARRAGRGRPMTLTVLCARPIAHAPRDVSGFPRKMVQAPRLGATQRYPAEESNLAHPLCRRGGLTDDLAGQVEREQASYGVSIPALTLNLRKGLTRRVAFFTKRSNRFSTPRSVDQRRFELRTNCLQSSRSTDWSYWPKTLLTYRESDPDLGDISPMP